MDLRSVKLDLFYTVVTLIVIGLLYYALPERKIEPHGIFMSSQSTATATKPTHNIPVLTAYPSIYESLGHISVTMALQDNTEAGFANNLRACKDQVRALAEEAGAAAVIILRATHYNKSGSLNATVLHAEAIR